MNQPEKIKKVAIVHDDFIQKGGAERLVECLLEMYPHADLHTSIISPSWHEKLLSINPNLIIRLSFMNKIPYKEKLYKALAPLYPIAFWFFDFSDYDLVISSTARFAHGIRTPGNTLHVAYVNSPARMIWEPHIYFSKIILFLLYPFLILLRMWDKFVSKNPNVLIANSHTVQERIQKFWDRQSVVVYPFHNLNTSEIALTNRKSDYYIVVSRLEKWKRIELAIRACCSLGQKLVIVGEGKDRVRLESIADSRYVKFMGRLPESDLIQTYLGAKALIMTQKEDFGITAVEAQSLGVPVIAYKEGGSTETILPNKTGIFFNHQNTDSLKLALQEFEKIEFDPEMCIIQAAKFTKDQFIRRISEITQK